MRYNKFEVRYVDEDGDTCVNRCRTRKLAYEMKAFYESLRWAGERLSDIVVVEYP